MRSTASNSGANLHFLCESFKICLYFRLMIKEKLFGGMNYAWSRRTSRRSRRPRRTSRRSRRSRRTSWRSRIWRRTSPPPYGRRDAPSVAHGRRNVDPSAPSQRLLRLPASGDRTDRYSDRRAFSDILTKTRVHLGKMHPDFFIPCSFFLVVSLPPIRCRAILAYSPSVVKK